MSSSPRASFPQQDTGLIIGLAEAAQDISYPAMAERIAGRDRRGAEGSGCRLRRRQIGAGGATATLNQGRVFIALSRTISATPAPTR